MINTLLFDLGNVILPFDVSRLARRLMAHSSLLAEEIVSKLWNEPIADSFETGRMTPEAYFEHVSSQCQFRNLTFADFVPIFNGIFEEDEEVVELISSLKKNYKLGLISNTNPIHAPYVVSRYVSLGHFEQRWFSNEAGVRKPDPALFKLALAYFSIPAKEAVFIDDNLVNVTSAKNHGLHAIHFNSASQLKKDLMKLGVGC